MSDVVGFIFGAGIIGLIWFYIETERKRRIFCQKCGKNLTQHPEIYYYAKKDELKKLHCCYCGEKLKVEK